MDRVKYVARWIAMVPCALAAVLLAPHIVGVLFWITTLARPVAFDPESFLDQVFLRSGQQRSRGRSLRLRRRICRPGSTAPCRVFPRGPQRADIGNHTLSRRRDVGRPMGDLGDSLDRHRVPRRCFMDSQGRNRFDVGGFPGHPDRSLTDVDELAACIQAATRLSAHTGQSRSTEESS